MIKAENSGLECESQRRRGAGSEGWGMGFGLVSFHMIGNIIDELLALGIGYL